MFRIFFLTLLMLSTTLLADLQLKGKLAEAHPSSYVVIEQNKTFTFFHIQERQDQRIILEEVSIPAASFSKKPMPWKSWFESGAPGHTSWIISQVNLETGQFEETFSFTHQGWIDMSSSNTFLTTLLNLRFREVDESDRRRVGLPPGHNKADHRPLWNPRLTVNGAVIPRASFHVYKARWPSDGSDLSRKTIEIYLPDAQPEGAWFPAYFPYWLEIEGKIGSARARVVDSGLEAKSPRTTLPKRAPQLMGQGERTPEGLLFSLKSPIYFRQFFVFVAEEEGSFFGNLLSLPATTTSNGESVSLQIPNEELAQLQNPLSHYRFLISPQEDPSIVLEGKVPQK